MRGTPVAFRQPGRGGVNYLDSLATLQDYEASDVRNVVSTTRGAVRKRAGSTSLATPGAALTSLHASVNPNFLIGAGGTALYSIDAAGVVTTIATGQASGGRWEFLNAPALSGQGPVYGMNGVDAPRQWGGSGSTSVWTAASGTLPNGRYLAYAGNRVFVAGMATYAGIGDPASALVFSALGTPLTWDAANFVQLDPGDGSPITGIGTSGPNLLVFKHNKAWLVYDLNTGANRRIGVNVGCVAHRSIVESPYGTFFLSEDHGVMLTDGSSARRVSDRVLPLIDTILPAQRANAAGAFFEDHYYLSICTTGTYNNLMLDYDVKAETWWVHTLGEQAMAVWNLSGQPALYGAKSSEARVSRLFVDGVTVDDGVPFSCYWHGPFHTFGRPEIQKRVRMVAFDGTGRISLRLTTDYRKVPDYEREYTFATDTGLFGNNDVGVFGTNDGNYFGSQTYTVAQARVATPGVGRAWSVQFGNETSDDFEVDGYSMLTTARTN